MTTLDWLLVELMAPIEDYIKNNKEYADYERLLKQEADQAAKVAEAGTVSAIKSIADQADGGDGIVKESDTPADNGELTTTTVPSSTSSQAEEMWYGHRYLLAAKTLVFVNMGLTSAKLSEANAFVSLINSAKAKPLGTKKDEVSKRLIELRKIAEDELEKMKAVLLRHKHPSGSYEAMLRIFIDMLTCMLQEKNIHTLCVALKYEGSTADKAILPLTKQLISYLTQQMLSLQLDDNRDKQKAKLAYVRIMPEVAAGEVIQNVLFVVDELDVYNSKMSEPERRLSNLIITLGYLIECNKQLSPSVASGLLVTTQNPFMEALLSSLNEYAQSAKQTREQNIDNALSSKLKLDGVV